MEEIRKTSPEAIKADVAAALNQLLDQTKYRPGDFVVIGCSSSEIIGKKIGSVGSMEAAAAVFEGAS